MAYSMRSVGSTLLYASFSGLLSTLASAQISDVVQENLERLALSTLNNSQSLSDVSHASELLTALGSSSASDSALKGITCKRVAKMLYEEDSDIQNLPSNILNKAILHKNFGCETLGGVTDQIDALVSASQSNMHELSDSELYAAYKLYKQAGAFGAKDPPSVKLEDLMAERAMNDWLKNWKPEKWTYKVKRSEIFEEETVEKVIVNELDIPMLQMTEMLASLMSRKSMRYEIEPKLSSALQVLMKEAYPENGRFFLPKNPNKIDSAQLTYHAI